ncbi:hypothetical protein RQP46_005571 [Phenoliferia psychrophenolica]
MLALPVSLLLTLSTAVSALAIGPVPEQRQAPSTLQPHTSKRSAISLTGLVGILAPADCGTNSVVGFSGSGSLSDIISICVCVNILSLGPGQSACPACPTNASPVCDDTRNTPCNCACNSPYVSDGAGACVLPPSASARKRSRGHGATHDQSAVGSLAYSAARCPNNESACPIANSKDGWECLDTRTSLDSCGGCLATGGVDCLAIPGVMGVGCVSSQCEISSCMPGWSLKEALCVLSTL